MKRISRFIALLAFALLGAMCGHAQIVLHASDYPSSLVGTDTLRVSTAASLFPAFSSISPATWDMTVVTDSATFLFRNKMGPISASLFYDSATAFLGNFEYPQKVKHVISASGCQKEANTSHYVATDLSFMTASPTDTLFIPDNTESFSIPEQLLRFPVNVSSNWSTAFFSDLQFELSYALFFYDHEPGYIRTYTNRDDKVTAWGKMRVRDAAGAPSAYYDVLQVQTTTITTDSAFLSGGPMPGHIQLLIGVTQGKSDTAYTLSYYQVGEITPLARVEFSDATFSHPLRATTRVVRPSASASPADRHGSVTVFPNPATNFIRISGPRHLCERYLLCDASGHTVIGGNSENPARLVDIPETAPVGLYYLHVFGKDGQSFVAPLVITR